MKDLNDNMSPEDALAEMMAESSAVQENIQHSQEETTSHDSLAQNTETTVAASSNQKILMTQGPRILAQIDEYMGDFFNSLKSVDERFSRVADTFYSTAHSIASKKNITKEEFNEMAINMALGIAVKGVGNIWNSIQKKDALDNVKQILAKEAKEKLGQIQEISKDMTDMVDIAEERYDICVKDGADAQRLYESFCNLRMLLYAQRLNNYLDATYSAALEGKFQDDKEFPNMYFINNGLLDFLIGDDTKVSSDEAILEKYRENVKVLFESMKHTMSSGGQATAPQELVARDTGLMAVAIHNVFPISLSSTDDEGIVTISDDSTLPLSSQYYQEFEELYRAAEDNSQNPLARTLLANEVFTTMVYHHIQTKLESERYEKRLGLMVINVVLAAVAGFLSGLYQNYQWYWSLLLGLGAGAVIAWMSPWKSSRKKYDKKVIYIERTIQKSALDASGYKENIDLKAIEKQNSKTWLYVIIGAILGLIIFAPIGWLIGGLLGAAISNTGGKDKDNTDYDYTKVKTGSMIPSYIVTALLIGFILILSYNVFFKKSDDKKSGKTSVENVETVVTEEVAPETVVEEVVAKEELVYPEQRPASDMGTYPVAVDGETVYTYVGNIGQYPIKMELVFVEEYEDGSQVEADGRYKYIKAGNILTFNGRLYYGTGEYVLNEYTSEGFNSGRFNLKKQDNYLVGKFTNLSNGKEYEVKLELTSVD